MTKKEVKQLLPFNTITKCEKEYCRLVKKVSILADLIRNHMRRLFLV